MTRYKLNECRQIALIRLRRVLRPAFLMDQPAVPRIDSVGERLLDGVIVHRELFAP